MKDAYDHRDRTEHFHDYDTPENDGAEPPYPGSFDDLLTPKAKKKTAR